MFEKLKQARDSPYVTVALVYATLMVDNMLLTVVVPILPEYFYNERLKNVDIGIQLSEVHAATTTTPYLNSVINGTENLTSFDSSISRNQTAGCVESSYFGLLLDENIYIAFLFASKPFVQIISNFIVGPITDKIGYTVPMMMGYIILVISSLVFAFGVKYETLLCARALQGVGSACGATAGMAMLANEFRDDVKRGQMMSFALGGLAMGVLVGPTFGSLFYEVSGKKTPFIILAVMAVLLLLNLLCIRKVEIKKNCDKNSDMMGSLTLLKDPYILLAAFLLSLTTMSIGIVEAGQPIWMMQTMCPTKWMLGFAFLPESISYLIGTYIFGWCSQKIERYLVTLTGMVVVGTGSIALPFSKNVWELWGPGLLIGGGLAMLDVTVFPIMGWLVDIRHEPKYGRIYAIADNAFCLSFLLGPLITGLSIHATGYKHLMIGCGVAIIAASPLTILLRHPPVKNLEDTEAILSSSNVEGTSRNYESFAEVSQ